MAGKYGEHLLNKDKKSDIFREIQNSAACRNWRSLGRVLGLDESEIDAISTDYPQLKEQCFQMLEAWFKDQSPTGNNHAVLLEALESISCGGVAEEIEKKFFQPAFYEDPK